MTSLFAAGAAEGEEVVRAAAKACLADLAPVLPETGVREVSAFLRFDVGEANVVSGDSPPVDVTLMAGDVNAVALAVP